MLAGGGIDSPGERARASRVHNEFGAAVTAGRGLNTQLRNALSVGAAAVAALEQDPKEFVCVRVKEGPKELAPRRSLVSETFATLSPTYLDLAEFCAALVVGGGLGAAAIPPDDGRDVLGPQQDAAEPSLDGDRRAPASNSNNRSWACARRG